MIENVKSKVGKSYLEISKKSLYYKINIKPLDEKSENSYHFLVKKKNEVEAILLRESKKYRSGLKLSLCPL